MNLSDLFRDADWVWETRLPGYLGISRDELRTLRKKLLTDAADFRLEKNRAEISRAGLDKLLAYLKALPAAGDKLQTPGPVTPPPEKPIEKKVPAEPTQPPLLTNQVELLVWRANLPNRRILEAYKPGTDPADRRNILRVQVRDASKYTRYDQNGKPMAVRCRHLQADLYEAAGPAPRRKGRY